MQQAGMQQQTAQQQKDLLCSGVLSATGVFMAPPLLSKMPKRSRSERQSPQRKQTLRSRNKRQREQAPTRPRDDKRAATVLRRRSLIVEVQLWELGRCSCLAPCRVLPIFKSFDPRYCEHVHRCYECLKPAKKSDAHR